MAVLPMHYIPNPILRERAKKIRKFDTPELHKLANDMIESMVYYEGVGIAANQVGSLRRICIIQMPEDEEPTVLLNLEITRKEGDREVTEGCLSLPGWQGRILRAEKVWARGVDLQGKPVRYKGAEDLLAQAIEHECDHLDGILFTDHVRSQDDLYEVIVGEEELGEGEVPPDTDDATTYECHDCGEVYPPGVSTAPCVEQGHYVGPMMDCDLPMVRPDVAASAD